MLSRGVLTSLLFVLLLLLQASQRLVAGEGEVNAECVILLHGLARGADSMKPIESRLVMEGYQVSNVGYPSREESIDNLATYAVETGLKECGGAPEIHFVTHSLGGILVRSYLSNHTIARLGRVVMLGPPNGGSEIVDKLGDLGLFQFVNGPAGSQLGTGDGSVPRSLGSVTYPVGIIAGSRSINPFLSTILPGRDDGKVTIESTKLEGMREFLEVPHTHTFMMRSKQVIDEVVCFLDSGHFQREQGGELSCLDV